MKIRVALISALLVLVGMCGFVGAYTIDYAYTTVGNEFTSSYAGAIVETFDAPLHWAWSGNGAIATGSLSGHYAAPFGAVTADTSNYVTVPYYSANGSATALLGATYNYLGLWWGSVDTYNSLEFYNGNNLVEKITGLDITNPANGNQTAPSTNLYVNFYSLPDFDSFRMVSTNYAFEADNVAVGTAPVPEPATFLLLGSGLIGLAWFGRKRKD